MVIVIKIIVLLIVFIRQFSVTYDIFYNSAILADTKHYVEKLSKSVSPKTKRLALLIKPNNDITLFFINYPFNFLIYFFFTFFTIS